MGILQLFTKLLGSLPETDSIRAPFLTLLDLPLGTFNLGSLLFGWTDYASVRGAKGL